MEHYFELVDRAVREEECRVSAYMNPSTRVKTLVVVLQELMLRCKGKVKESFPILFRACDDKIQVILQLFCFIGFISVHVDITYFIG